MEKALEEAGDKISENDKAAVEADLNALKDLLKDLPQEGITDAQVTDIKAAKDKLLQSAQSLFTKMYEDMQQAAGAQGGAQGAGPEGGAAGNSDDDVVDADYKEV